jgi:TatA/E family protein of Tat protein translocase
MHFGDSIFIFLLALVLFGPKKLPEIGRTIGKLLAEFRRASNEFKFQIQEELRTMEDEERRKKLAEVQAQKAAEANAGNLARAKWRNTGRHADHSAPIDRYAREHHHSLRNPGRAGQRIRGVLRKSRRPPPKSPSSRPPRST